MGMVARDHLWRIVGIHSFKVQTRNLELAKLEAVKFSMEIAMGEEWSKIIRAGNAQAIFQSLEENSKSALHWSTHPTLNHINRCSSFFDNISFV